MPGYLVQEQYRGIALHRVLIAVKKELVRIRRVQRAGADKCGAIDGQMELHECEAVRPTPCGWRGARLKGKTVRRVQIVCRIVGMKIIAGQRVQRHHGGTILLPCFLDGGRAFSHRSSSSARNARWAAAGWDQPVCAASKKVTTSSLISTITIATQNYNFGATTSDMRAKALY